MKNFKTVLLVLSVVLNVFLVYKFFLSGNTVPNEKDSRVAIQISEPNREIVMAEMRTFLEAVKNIHDGIEASDYQKIELNATNSGMSVEKHIPAELIRSLPLSFKKLGFDTHERFDKIAQYAKEQKSKELLHQEMSGLLNNCTSCHASYKIVSK